MGFNYNPVEHADLLEAMKEKIENGLRAEKGAWWARKVIYVAGMKAYFHGLNKKEPGIADVMTRLLALDVVKDLAEQYPERDSHEVVHEFMADCDKLINGIFDEAFGRGII